MAKVDIDDKLKQKIEEWLSINDHRFEIPNTKSFVNRACYYQLKLLKKRKD